MGPRVRIRFPPGESPLRTWPSRSRERSRHVNFSHPGSLEPARGVVPLGYADVDALPSLKPIKPNPLAALYHFTVLISWTLASRGCRSNGDLKFFGISGGRRVVIKPHSLEKGKRNESLVCPTPRHSHFCRPDGHGIRNLSSTLSSKFCKGTLSSVNR
jgi:hypothetical protein